MIAKCKILSLMIENICIFYTHNFVNLQHLFYCVGCILLSGGQRTASLCRLVSGVLQTFPAYSQYGSKILSLPYEK